MRPCLSYRSTCPRCRFIARASVAVSLGWIRAVPDARCRWPQLRVHGLVLQGWRLVLGCGLLFGIQYAALAGLALLLTGGFAFAH